MVSKTVPVKLRWLNPIRDRELVVPTYHSKLAAGMDVRAAIVESLTIEAGDIALIGSGFAIAIPPGYELQVRPRSGLAIKHGITLVNSPGTIDADYRGEVKIGLINLAKKPFTINRGDRIAQLVLAPVCQAVIAEVDELPTSQREDGGFGHTGLK